jgi:hypothetical protein
MVASEYAEKLFCQCLHADSDSAFVVENHLEAQEDLIAVCLAEAGAEYAVINQATTAAGVTAFLEHINSGALDEQCPHASYHSKSAGSSSDADEDDASSAGSSSDSVDDDAGTSSDSSSSDSVDDDAGSSSDSSSSAGSSSAGSSSDSLSSDESSCSSVTCPLSWRGDGECDEACDSRKCGYDGGDCSSPSHFSSSNAAYVADELNTVCTSLTLALVAWFM